MSRVAHSPASGASTSRHPQVPPAPFDELVYRWACVDNTLAPGLKASILNAQLQLREGSIHCNVPAIPNQVAELMKNKADFLEGLGGGCKAMLEDLYEETDAAVLAKYLDDEVKVELILGNQSETVMGKDNVCAELLAQKEELSAPTSRILRYADGQEFECISWAQFNPIPDSNFTSMSVQDTVRFNPSDMKVVFVSRILIPPTDKQATINFGGLHKREGPKEQTKISTNEDGEKSESKPVAREQASEAETKEKDEETPAAETSEVPAKLEEEPAQPETNANQGESRNSAEEAVESK